MHTAVCENQPHQCHQWSLDERKTTLPPTKHTNPQTLAITGAPADCVYIYIYIMYKGRGTLFGYTTDTLAAAALHLSRNACWSASRASQHTTTPIRRPTCASGLPKMRR